MFKRTVALILWFTAAWTAWNVFAAMTGWTDAVGPVVGLVVGLLIAIDPTHAIWTAVEPAPVVPAERRADIIDTAAAAA